MRGKRPIALVAALAWSAGCYAYTPIATSTPPAGLQVSAELTDRGTADLGRLLGMGAVEVRGRVAQASDSTVTLAVQAVKLRNGTETFWQGERVTLEREMIARLNERRVSRRKSFLAGGALLAGAAVAAIVIGAQGGGSAPPGGGQPGPR
jgi:hypothetical protein